jgi:hypothetical protein
MSSKTFLSKENISMIWDVISDEDICKFLSKDIQQKIASVFTSNLKGFFDNESEQIKNLIDINKKYIVLILNYIKQNYPTQQPNKIKILEEISQASIQKDLITYEEIQNDRKSQFEKDLNKRQEEFTNSMSLPVPSVPEFGDKIKEVPITGMEKIIKEMTAQRNYEVEQINRSYQQNDNWLKPQETSIKNDKNMNSNSLQLEQNGNSNNTNNNRLKYIKIDNEEITLDSPDRKKNVTWGANSEISELELNVNTNNNSNSIEDNIFKKLKKINNVQAIPTIAFEEPFINQLTEDRIKTLEFEMKELNIKMDMLINLIKQNK